MKRGRSRDYGMFQFISRVFFKLVISQNIRLEKSQKCCRSKFQFFIYDPMTGTDSENKSTKFVIVQVFKNPHEVWKWKCPLEIVYPVTFDAVFQRRLPLELHRLRILRQCAELLHHLWQHCKTTARDVQV